MRKIELSIIILSYNTKDLLRKCLLSLEKLRKELSFEVIVCDNGSIDGSSQLVGQEFGIVKLVENHKNLGFAKGNNAAKSVVKGKYILFLNSDTEVFLGTLKATTQYLEKNPSVGAITCKILLPDGGLDKDARRSFITPWIGMTHLILKLDKVFPKSKFFAKYWYGYISPDIEHEVDALQGAFFMTRKKVLDTVGWFDEDYFLDGEDIDLSWKIKEKGWKIVYYPKVSIVHYKGASKGKVDSKTKYSIPLKDRLKYRMAGVNSMEMFYRKHLWNKYSIITNITVIVGIKLLKLVRFTRTLLLG